MHDQGGLRIDIGAGLSPTLMAQCRSHLPCVIPYWCRPDKNSRPVEVSTTLDRNYANPSAHQGGIAVVQTVAPQLHGGSMIVDDKAGTLRSRCVFSGTGGDSALAVVQTVSVQGYGSMIEDERVSDAQLAVRRLTVTECERLMGFPDGYTRIAYRGKPAEQCPDTPRYAALGNSWAVPVVRWIGERLQTQMREASHGDA